MKYMGNFMYPNSETRKLYGKAGRKAEAQAKRFGNILSERERLHNADTSVLKSKVLAYQNLPWYKKLWLAIKELFGYKKTIL